MHGEKVKDRTHILGIVDADERNRELFAKSGQCRHGQARPRMWSNPGKRPLSAADEAQSDGITRMARHVLGGHSRDSGPPGSPLGSMIVESRAARAGLKGPKTSRN